MYVTRSAASATEPSKDRSHSVVFNNLATMDSLDLEDFSFLNEKMIQTDYPSVDYEMDAFEPLFSSVYSGSL